MCVLMFSFLFFLVFFPFIRFTCFVFDVIVLVHFKTNYTTTTVTYTTTAAIRTAATAKKMNLNFNSNRFHITHVKIVLRVSFPINVPLLWPVRKSNLILTLISCSLYKSNGKNERIKNRMCTWRKIYFKYTLTHKHSMECTLSSMPYYPRARSIRIQSARRLAARWMRTIRIYFYVLRTTMQYTRMFYLYLFHLFFFPTPPCAGLVVGYRGIVVEMDICKMFARNANNGNSNKVWARVVGGNQFIFKYYTITHHQS